jgi:hypothetical protein
VKGLVADANIQGQVDYLAQRMQVEAWADFWQALGLYEQLLRGARSRGTVRLPHADRRRPRYGPALPPLKPDWALARVLEPWLTGLRRFCDTSFP